MSIEISIPGGTARRLLTGGKYCPDDILVTAEGTVLPELSDPGTAADLMEGKELLGGAGAKVTGTFTLAEELAAQDALLEQISEALDGKVGGSGAADPTAGYTRLEYAASDGEAYVLTDFVGDNTCGMEIVAAFPALEDRVPMGSRVDSGATRFYCAYPLSASSCYFGFNTGSSFSCALSVDTVYRLQTNFLNSRLVNVFDEDGIRKGGTSISVTLVEQTCAVAIWGYQRTDTGVGTRREFTLYSARCSRGHEVVREYIPCRRESDGMVGLFEKYTGTFIEPDGGVLTGGPDVDW